MKRSRPKKRSDKKKLRDRIGKLHLEYLKLTKGNNRICEICGKVTHNLGRFHILRVGLYPRLEFVDLNVLLAGWYCCHYPHHHYGGNDHRVRYINQRIEMLRGENYEEELLKINVTRPKHTMFYLEALEIWLKQMIEDIT